MAATSGEGGVSGNLSAVPVNTPPIIAMTIIAVTLVVLAQFGSTERLAAAMAWLIFVAVFLANGQQALATLAGVTSVGKSTTGAVSDITNGAK